jgi:hypothetical protein
LAIAGWQSVGVRPGSAPKAGKTSKKVKKLIWQLPLDKSVLTLDNGSVSRASRLS